MRQGSCFERASGFVRETYTYPSNAEMRERKKDVFKI